MKKIAKDILKIIIQSLGPRRVLHMLKEIDPNCLGSYVASDYVKHLHDPIFQIISEKSNNYTLVDILRRHELWSLVRQSSKLDHGDYLEVGVWRGGSGLIIAEAIKHFKIASQLYLADTFEGVAKAGSLDNAYVGGEHSDTSEALVRGLLDTNGHGDVELLTGIFPDDTGYRAPERLRFIHIDVDVYQSAKDIVEWAYSRLVPEGIIVFDDYGFLSCGGITKLCEEYELDPRFLFIHNVNGHCILFKSNVS